MRKRLSISIVFSVIGHFVLVGLLLINFTFNKIETDQTQPVSQINATAVDSSKVRQQIKQREDKSKQQRQAEINRKNKIKRQKEAERKKKKRLADQKAKKQREKKAAEQQKKKAAEEVARKQREAEAEEAERKKVAEENKQKTEDAQRKTDETRRLEEQLLAEQMEAEQQAQAARRETVMSEVEYYKALIKSAIQGKWIEPKRDGYCIFRLRLAPGGLVLDFEPLEDVGRFCDSSNKAVFKAQPLPMSRDLDVIDELRDLNFVLKPAE